MTEKQLKKIRQQIEVEFFNFKTLQLTKTKEEIFYNFYEIRFYNEMFDYLTDVELSDEEYSLLRSVAGNYQSVLSKLYRQFMDMEEVSIESYSEIRIFLDSVFERVKTRKRLK